MKMKFNFDKKVDRYKTASLKWDNLKKYYPNAKEDPFVMWVADMDFECAPCILDALHKRVDHGVFGYSAEGEKEYAQVIYDWMMRRHNWDVDKEAIFFSPGILAALGYIIQLLTEPGEGIIIQQPVYYPFSYLPKGNERKLVDNSLICKDGKYEMDYEDLEEKLKDDNNKMLILCNPHNPVGRAWTKEELSKFVALCKKYNKIIISDEIHFDLTRTGVTHTVLETVDPSYKNNIITCTAPSKSFNLAGLQNSNIIINDPKIQEEWRFFTRYVAHLDGPNTFGAIANLAAYEEGEEWLDEARKYIDGNIALMEGFIIENLPKLKLIECEATYLTWVDFSGYGLADEEVDRILIEEAGVLLDNGLAFGEPGQGYQRFNVSCPRSTVEGSLQAIKAAFAKYE